MKRPSFQFYPADWRNNANLGRCSLSARGAWVDVMCVLHDSDEYGLVRWPLKDLASSAKVPISAVRELVEKGVLKGADKGAQADAYIYVPRSGRRDGAPVALIPAQAGPLWYSSRMVKDEYVRTIRGEGTRFGDESGEASKHSPKPPISDGPSSSSSSSTSVVNTNQASLDPAFPAGKQPDDHQAEDLEKPKNQIPDCPHREILALWQEVLPALPQHNPEFWRGARAARLRARWRETAALKGWKTEAEGIDYFRRFFGYVGQSKFLSGRASVPPGKTPFVAELAWLVCPENWAKTHEGKYHTEGA